MSDRFSTSMDIGGELPEEQFDELRGLFDGWEEHGIDEDSKWFHAFDPEIRYEGTSEIEAFCQEHNLTYSCQVDPKYEYDGEFVFWKPGMEERLSYLSNGSGEIYFTTQQLQARSDAGQTLLGILAEVNDGGFQVPPFVLVPRFVEVPPGLPKREVLL